MPDRGFRSGSSRSEPITLTPRRSACIWIRFRPKSGRDALAFVPQTTGRSSRQIVDHGWLEIQAYHEVPLCLCNAAIVSSTPSRPDHRRAQRRSQTSRVPFNSRASVVINDEPARSNREGHHRQCGILESGGHKACAIGNEHIVGIPTLTV